MFSEQLLIKMKKVDIFISIFSFEAWPFSKNNKKFYIIWTIVKKEGKKRVNWEKQNDPTEWK